MSGGVSRTGGSTPRTVDTPEPEAPETTTSTTSAPTAAPPPTSGTPVGIGRAIATAAAPFAAPATVRLPDHVSGVPRAILEKYGLDPDKPSTSSEYTGEKWNVGYMPYSGDVQYAAFARVGSVFGNPRSGLDGHAYWERYSNPPSGLAPGSWIASGHINESSFETTAGVDVSGNREISNDLYKLIREGGVPSKESFAVRDQEGKELAVRPGDRLVPTAVLNGRVVEAEDRGSGFVDRATGVPVQSVAYRLKGSDGQIRGGPNDKVEDRAALLGLSRDVKFDFLDAGGDPVAYNATLQQIVPTYRDAENGRWNAFVPKRDGAGKITGYEHQTLDDVKDDTGKVLDDKGARVTARRDVSVEEMSRLTSGKELIHRVQDKATGKLNGDGKVGLSYDMSWWGKCHNVASIGTSNMPKPKQDVNVVTNLDAAAGDQLGLEYSKDGRKHVLLPKRDAEGQITGYSDTTRDAGPVSGRDMTAAEARQVAADKKATPVIVTRDGRLKAAETTRAGTSEVTALTAHISNGAVEYKGSMAARYWGYPDEVVLRDGNRVSGFVTSVETEGGQTVEVGSKKPGGDYSEKNRDVLRGPGLESGYARTPSGRQLGWSEVDFAALQGAKSGGDKIKTVTITKPDGTTQKVDAADVERLGWENKFDMRPEHLWKLHSEGLVGAQGSTVIEADAGPHVWNYTITSASTTPLKPGDAPASLKARPGQLRGTTDDANRHYFSSEINGTKYNYWAKFDAEGKVQDFAYDGNVPDFFWTQHVKDPYSKDWEGESQARGVTNRELQRMYLASVGGYDPYALPGNVLTRDDLMTRRAVRPPNP